MNRSEEFDGLRPEELGGWVKLTGRETLRKKIVDRLGFIKILGSGAVK